jgi:YbgC/YbaW family acyl-CoA thioester hydrolase
MAQCFSMTRRVQFAETDLAGVVHFSNYFRMMEEVEHAFWRSLGLSVKFGEGSGYVSWPRVSASGSFLAPIHFEEELRLDLTICRQSQKSLEFRVAFRRGEQVVARGTMKTVCCAIQGSDFKAIPIPAEVSDKLAPYVEQDDSQGT